MSYVEYNSNNSGGSWWLRDADWKALEEAGWIVQWFSLSPLYNDEGGYVLGDHGVPKLVPVAENNSKYPALSSIKEGGRFLGALAQTAYRVGLSLREAAEEWEKITGGTATDAGCPCCGQPHRFTEYDDDGRYVKSGPETAYEASW